jgi:hypothetical protein
LAGPPPDGVPSSRVDDLPTRPTSPDNLPEGALNPDVTRTQTQASQIQATSGYGSGFTLTFHAPGASGEHGMEGPFETPRPGKDGKSIPKTLDDVRMGKSDYVTLAGDPRRYGEEHQLGTIRYRGADGQIYTLPDVRHRPCLPRMNGQAGYCVH